ncbi:MAG: DNA helicase PcrA [Lachnospiraceae bacterium]|nr:DNA helicase PcrA [Lachnospiraceae bacterium]
MGSIYDTLNDRQKEAVFATEGPVLVLAGAGSGKTRALTHRIAYLIDEKKVNPWNILAITFTNKAAAEMRERVNQLVEFGAESIWVSTFHSMCVRILRRYGEWLGYDSSFSIYDTEDQKVLIRQIIKKMDLDSKLYRERAVLSEISAAKNELITPEEFYIHSAGEFRRMKIGELYQEYQEQMKKNNAMDFDDLIMKTVELFRNNSEVLSYYQNRFRYILVDEYQDTNTAQFELVNLLASQSRNLCVVGDDDQSIYRFRGANIYNILSFEESYPGAKVIRLEQNYRSTQNILNVANHVIRRNGGRKDKTLWTENGEGDRVRYGSYDTAREEAASIVRDILCAKEAGEALRECAVLYRTNAQSRVLEEQCVSQNLPYRLIGGVNFYQRQEIKDILAYLKTIENGQDDLAAERIINVPKRGIGQTSIGKVAAFAVNHDMSFYEACLHAEHIPTLGKAAGRILAFVAQIESFRAAANETDLESLIREVLLVTGYQKELEDENTPEALARIENLEELISKAVDYEGNAPEGASLGGFLEQVALVAEVDNLDADADRIVLMTLHSAKGLEFERVYLAGLEEGLFPSYRSANGEDLEALEEERRLCYVGITRAKKNLMLTSARQRMVNGEVRYNAPSRFLSEIPAELLEEGNRTGEKKTAVSSYEEDRRNLAAGFGRKKASDLARVSTAQTKAAYSLGREFVVNKSEGLSYIVGDRVSHLKFGEGVVTAIREQKRDYEVTVDFENFGLKKMYASFAKLKKIDSK